MVCLFLAFGRRLPKDAFRHELEPFAGAIAVPSRWELDGSLQLAVRSPKGRNNVTKLPHGTSVFELEAPLPGLSDMAEKNGLRLFTLESALIVASPRFFLHHATDARAAMAMIRDASDLLSRLLDGGHSTIAGRLAGSLPQ